jgi:putative oxidoreductase
MKNPLKNYWQQLPDFALSHILLRIPLALVFISQSLSKMPFDPAMGASFGLPPLVWWFVAYGELSAGIGLLVGGLATLPRVSSISVVSILGDLITRFSGIVMCCIATGVIWTVIKPESLWSFIMTDYMHFSLWAGGLYFALRGNWAVAVSNNKDIK